MTNRPQSNEADSGQIKEEDALEIATGGTRR